MSDIAATEEKRALNAHLWERHPDDWYTEPDWVDERLFEQEKFAGPIAWFIWRRGHVGLAVIDWLRRKP